MKRFIIISLLAVLGLPASACIWWSNYNNYLFSPYDTQEFREYTEKTCNDNWKAYLGSTEEYYWFDADEVIATAQRKNDPLMVTYIQNLQKYLKCADEKRQEQWDYPTKEQLAERRQTLLAVRSYAQTKLKTRLRSQHALLVMRCNMMLGEHAQNVTFWTTTASTLINSVYRDMMRNIYAGALCKTGSEQVGAKIFAEQGDWQSLMTIYYKRRSYQAIRQVYLSEPDSPVLPFLLKDFVNNAQEAVDADGQEGAIGGKLFIRNITKQEAQQMCQLCQQVVREGKTDIPVMWQSAKAWLEYLFDNKKLSVSDIDKTETMEGTQRMKDNARVLRFYINAAQMASGKALDDFVASELTWLDDKVKEEKEEGFFRSALERTAHQVLMKRYVTQPSRLLAIEKATGCQEYTETADTMKVESMLRYMAYAETPSMNALDRYLKKELKTDRDAMNDLIGTKYMRLCQWENARPWIEKVPLAFYKEQGYSLYAAFRQFNIEPWITRQWDKEDQEPSQRPQLKTNPKLAFIRDMQRLEASEKVLTGSAQQQCWYDQAVRYAQASYTGDCWYVMRDSKSIYDTVRSNETDMAQKAATLLRKASTATDFVLKEKVLFALSYVYLNKSRWYDEVWNDNTLEYDRKPLTQTTQWRAFATLADLEKQNATRTSKYVSRCDEYVQFLKHYR